jgi:hypothetical protein
MKNMIVLFAALALLGSVATATPASCTAETLNNYLVPGFSCVIDNLLFSNFTYAGTASGGGTAIPAAGVSVSPITTLDDEGLEFNAGWSVTSGEEDSDINFKVSTVNGAATIDYLDLEFNGAYTGTGSSGVTENYCKGGTLTSCPTSVAQIKVTNPPTVLSVTSQDFTPVSWLSVSKDVNVNAGSWGTASISDLSNTYGQVVPEPATMCLIGFSLVALGFVRKRS